MKNKLFFLILLLPVFKVAAQDFNLPADGKWYLVARIGGRHSEIDYTYFHTTAHTPSLLSGKMQFINAQNFAIQEHHSMGYAQWLQPAFALLNFGAESQIWVKAATGADVGTFRVNKILTGTLELGSQNDTNLADNGAIVTTYNQIRDNGHTYIGNLHVLDGNVGIGTDATAERLTVNGKIHAKEIKVDGSGMPDYVFEPDYPLRSLHDTENYIRMHKHLPEVPSAKTASEKGIELGQMNRILLRKIEELTLQLVEMGKKVDKLEHKGQNKKKLMQFRRK
ncbi:hypothetical protein [Pedobacter frigidisoli]|uniref:hypothetical protein n=1 Tax=Pedobacter frigidisoli TaxID=2530455 RepID=UPI002930FFD7|nr:hypothetical protein [Pedobacter frigidisoli]